MKNSVPEKLNRINNVSQYYNDYYGIYLDIWGNYDNLALHMGYYDDNDEMQSHDDSILKMNRVIANIAKIKKGDFILDAGCGVGGSSIWFAKNYDVKITGITLSEREVNFAKKIADERNIKNVEFKVMDFTDTEFDNEIFDIIFGIESVCHAHNKIDFLSESQRLLRKNGRIIVTDYFKKNETLSSREKNKIDKINHGYSVDLCSMNQFKEFLTNFENIELHDITNNVERSYEEGIKKIQKVYINSKASTLKQKILEELDRVILEFKCLQKGILKYGIITAEKKC